MPDPEEDSLGEIEDSEDSEVGVEHSYTEYTITSWRTDYPVDALVERLKKGAFMVPEFQRGYVWTKAQASRFIESLLIGLPVPGIFVYRDERGNQSEIIDGQQRLKTLRYFYEGKFDTGNRFALVGVKKEFEDKTYESLPPSIKQKLDEAIISATVIQQAKPENEKSSVYFLFERLNTGGTPLSPQEIRAALYKGPLFRLLSELNESREWRRLLGKKNVRRRDEELILRFAAIHEGFEDYERPMKAFLNRFLDRHENKGKASDLAARFRVVFDDVMRKLAQVDRAAFRPERALNASYLEAVFLALARLPTRDGKQAKALEGAIRKLWEEAEFRRACKTGTTHRENIRKRFEIASEAFAFLKK